MFFNMGVGGGSEFFEVPKLYGAKAQNFSNSQSPYRGGGTSTTMSLRVECSQLVFGEVTSTAVCLQEEFEVYMEETKE